MGKVGRDLDVNRTASSVDSLSDLHGGRVVDGIEIADRVVVQPHAVSVLAGRVLGQGVGAVSGRGTVEAELDGLARHKRGVVRDTLEHIQASVVTLSPS